MKKKSFEIIETFNQNINEYNANSRMISNLKLQFNDVKIEMNDLKFFLRLVRNQNEFLKQAAIVVSINEENSFDRNLLTSLTTFMNDSHVVKLSKSFVFIDKKDSQIDDWIIQIKKQFSRNISRFSIEKMKIFYAIVLMNDKIMNHISARLKDNSTRFFQQVQKIFDDLYCIYEIQIEN